MTHPTTRLLVSRMAFAACCVAGLFACRAATAATGRITVDVNGTKRAVTLVEHSRLKRAPRTAVIVLRGAAAGGRRVGLSRVDRFLGLDGVSASAGMVLAFPSAAADKWSFSGDKPDDVAMIHALATKLVADGIADKRRIFIAGVSSGGLLALRVLCDGADYLAGAAVLLANMPADMAKSCKPARPMAFFMLNGTADPLMPYQGGPAKLADFKDEVVSADATLAPFAAIAECGKNRASHELPDRDPKDGSRVVVHLMGCKAPLEVYRVDGGGHALPGRPVRADRGAVIGALNNDIDTARALADFIRRATR
jgi:polyhydroxybutyrate depolymerase